MLILHTDIWCHFLVQIWWTAEQKFLKTLFPCWFLLPCWFLCFFRLIKAEKRHREDYTVSMFYLQPLYLIGDDFKIYRRKNNYVSNVKKTIAHQWSVNERNSDSMLSQYFLFYHAQTVIVTLCSHQLQRQAVNKQLVSSCLANCFVLLRTHVNIWQTDGIDKAWTWQKDLYSTWAVIFVAKSFI